MVKAPGLGCFCNWSLAPTGIYYISHKPDEPRSIWFYEFASKTFSEILRLDKYAVNPAVSPDGKSLIYANLDQNDRTIMLLNNFH